MLKRDINCLIVGNNYLAYILSIIGQQGRKGNLLLDDDRVNLGSEWKNHIGVLERKYLENLGNRYGIGSLEKIGNYLELSSLIISFDKKFFYATESISLNFKEVFRRFPDLVGPSLIEAMNCLAFSDVDFDQEASLIIKKLEVKEGKIVLENSKLQKLITLLFDNYNNSTDLNVKHFWQYVELLFQQKISKDHTLDEFTHLVLALISPRYIINEKKLIKDLKNELVNKGGLFKNAHISNWQFIKKKVSYLELNSFEGVIRPESVYFVGKPNVVMPIRMRSIGPVYTMAHLKIEHLKKADTIFKDLHNVFITYFPFERWGKDIFFTRIALSSDGATAKVIFPLGKGVRSKFYLSDMKKIVFEILNSIALSNLNETEILKSISIVEEETFDEFIDLRKFKDHKKQNRKFLITEFNHPQLGHQINNIVYLGPRKYYSYGVLSQFREIINI
ncbi:MAG: hypothetical protein U0T83_03470 [Bacteriovoracaceae bacterium]